jgi:hypothetical protein
MIEDKKNLIDVIKSEIDNLYEVRCFILNGVDVVTDVESVTVTDVAPVTVTYVAPVSDVAPVTDAAAAAAAAATKKTSDLACGFNWADACDDEMDEIKISPPKSYVKVAAEFGAHEAEFQTVPVTYARTVPALPASRASPARSNPTSPAKNIPGKIACKIDSKLDGKSMKQFLIDVAKQRSSVTKNMDGKMSLLGTDHEDIYVLANSDGNTDINGEIGWTSRYYGNMLNSVHDAVASIDDKGNHDLIVVYAQKNPEGSYHKEQITVSLYMRRY